MRERNRHARLRRSRICEQYSRHVAIVPIDNGRARGTLLERACHDEAIYGVLSRGPTVSAPAM